MNPILMLLLKPRKNQYDGDLEDGKLNLATGEHTVDTSYFRTKNFHKVVRGATYAMQKPSGYEYGAGFFYDSNKNFLSVKNIGATFTADGEYMKHVSRRTDSAVITPTDILTFKNATQIEKSSAVTSYEAYKESVSYTPPNTVLRRLPNGTRDTIEQKSDGTWKKVQRVSDGVAVIGVVAVNTINYPLSQTGGSFINVLTAGGTETGIIGTNSTSADGTLYYQLATPMETYYTATPTLYSQPNGTVIAEPWNGSLIDTSTVAIPEKTYEYM